MDKNEKKIRSHVGIDLIKMKLPDSRASEPLILGSRNTRKKGGAAFHVTDELKRLKTADGELQEVIRSSKRRIWLSKTGAFLSMFGLVATFGLAEVCSRGYLPTDSEILEGMVDPYASSGPCSDSNALRLWLLQALVSLSTALLGVVVVGRNLVTLHEREQQIKFIARHSDTPDINTFSMRMRRARRQAMWRDTIIEILITVLPHPVPGLKHTFEIPALTRVGKYEFESLIVIFMFPRFYHVWKHAMCSLYYKNFEQCTYMLGNHHSIMTMMSHWEHLNSSFTLKMLFTEEPVKYLLGCFIALLFTASYCVRTAETPVNTFHAGLFGNQLWLTIVTMTTTGYGDNVPFTMFGRFACVVVMLLGTILVSMMTAACTEFLTLTPHQVLVTKYSLHSRRTKRVILVIVPLLQYIFRTSRGKRKQDWSIFSELRSQFWKKMYVYRAEAEEEAELHNFKPQAHPSHTTAPFTENPPAHLPPSFCHAQKTLDAGKEAGLTDNKSDNIAHTDDLATEMLNFKQHMTMEGMHLKADIERRFEKCTLEVQQVHECVAKILVMTTKVQDQTVPLAANMSATSTDKQKGSSRTRRSRRGGESASRATSEKPRSDPIHFSDAPYMAQNSMNPEASESKNTFGDGQVKVAEDRVCVTLLATPALGRDGSERTRSQGRYTSERDAKRLQQHAAQTEERPVASHNSSPHFQAHMFPAVMGGGSSDLTLISSSRGIKTGVIARRGPYSEGVAAQGSSPAYVPPLPPAVLYPSRPTMSLPPGWEELTDAVTQRKYYVNLVTHSTRWDRPCYISRSEPSSGRTGDLAGSSSTVHMPDSKPSGKPFLRDITGGKSTLVVIRRGEDKR